MADAAGIAEETGRFDLNSCSPVNRPWVTATCHYTIEDDGLRQSHRKQRTRLI